MARGMSGSILGDFQTLFHVGAVGSMTDGELLGRFVDDRANSGESAFRVLIHRHGPMVLGVCRRNLRDLQEAEDAFQATFLILASRARSIRNRDSVGPWLLGVARKVSARARHATFRRRFRERSLIDQTIQEPVASSPETLPFDELIDQVERLPKRLREPVVLCYWQGLTYDESASALGVTESTIRGRLARARDVLRSRLKRQEVTPLLVPGGLTRYWSEVIGPGLFSSTIKSISCLREGRSVEGLVRPSVAILWEGASSTMSTMKWKLAGVTLLSGIGLLGVGPGVLAWQGRALIADTPPEKKAGGAATVQALHQDLETNGLSELVDGKIVRTEVILKDTMILAYLPDWNHGGVDNIGFEGHDGGVRTLVDWPDVPATEAASRDLKFYLAFYARKAVENPNPAKKDSKKAQPARLTTSRVGSITALEIAEPWSESSSWNKRPVAELDAVGVYPFQPGDGWKVFDVTTFIRSKQGQVGHGLMFRYINEELPSAGGWTGYQIVSREGNQEWASKRPRFLVVESSEK